MHKSPVKEGEKVIAKVREVTEALEEFDSVCEEMEEYPKLPPIAAMEEDLEEIYPQELRRVQKYFKDEWGYPGNVIKEVLGTSFTEEDVRFMYREALADVLNEKCCPVGWCYGLINEPIHGLLEGDARKALSRRYGFWPYDLKVLPCCKVTR